MARFYILPPQEQFEAKLHELIQSWFPGQPLGDDLLRNFLEAVVGEGDTRSSAYVVFQDQLPGLDDLESDLALGFGFTADDVVCIPSI